jgi:hypothetical protein
MTRLAPNTLLRGGLDGLVATFQSLLTRLATSALSHVDVDELSSTSGSSFLSPGRGHVFRGNVEHLAATLQSLMLSPGQGQAFSEERLQLHASNARRAWTDPMVYSHGPMFAASCVSISRGIFELGLLGGVTLLLSIAYHRQFEKPGKLCAVEGIFAKLLFLYGSVQLFRAPTTALMNTELFCLFTTAAFFIFTNAYKKYYEQYHALGLHIVPALWAGIVGLNHSPILF